jgi:hypothetical protein
MEPALVLIILMLAMGCIITYFPTIGIIILIICIIGFILVIVGVILEKLFPGKFSSGYSYTPPKDVQNRQSEEDRIPPNDFPHSGGGY